jgi:uncharacterized membrane protein
MRQMPVIQRIAREIPQIPLGSKLGFVVIVLGLAADVIAHLTPGLEHNHGGASGTELSAHLVVFVGMALVLLGVVFDGVRSGRRAGRGTNSREAR